MMKKTLTVSANHFQHHIQVFEKLCGPFDYHHYQSKYGITLTKLRQADYRPPLTAATEFFLDAAKLLEDPCFGLTWANQVKFVVPQHILRKLGIAPDVATFLLQSGRLSSLTSELATYSLEPFDDHHHMFKITPANEEIICHHQLDAFLLFTKRITQTLLKYRYPETQTNGKDYTCALIPHEKPKNSQTRYEDEFGIPVLFSQKHCALLLPSQWLNYRLTPVDLSITDVIRCEIEQAKLDPSQLHTKTVANCVAALLPYGSPKREDVAKAFNMSLRSFQRRLNEEDTSYKKVLDDARKELSSVYLERDCYPIEEVAFLLGYSNISAFYTAFKRWHNTSPRKRV